MSDPKIATDAEIAWLRNEAQGTQSSWEANTDRDKPNGCWSNTLLLDAPLVLRILARLDAAESELAALRIENSNLKGAMSADDERLRNAERRIYADGKTFGCDAGEHTADEILELRAERAALRAKLTPGQSDEECAEKLILEDDEKWSDPQPVIDIIAAHVATRTSALEKRLAEAAGLVRRQAEHIDAYHQIIDLLNAKIIGLDANYFPSRQSFWDTVLKTKDIKLAASAFLAQEGK